MLGDFENMHKFKSDELYQEALSVIKGFKNPPAIEFLQKEPDVIPDIFVDITDNYIEVNLNDKYYPSVKVAVEGNDKSMDFVKMKLKEAKDLVDALEMRKATLYKLGLMIVEHQYEFFLGGDIKPMRLKDLSEDLDYNQSTISRAISNKYLECNRGVISLKDFFSTAIDEDLSNTSIKEFIKEIVKNENRDRPLSDIKILELIEKKFSITLSRRTITKYRKQLDISSSSERKSLYKLGG
jgi:RNA polymerase sigma-54 factor